MNEIDNCYHAFVNLMAIIESSDDASAMSRPVYSRAYAVRNALAVEMRESIIKLAEILKEMK